MPYSPLTTVFFICFNKEGEIMNNENNYTVYMHISPSNKVYVGITKQNPVDRWQNGKGYLKTSNNGEYHQPLMARAILKYGWDNFQHEIFDDCLSKEEAEKRERLLIALWQTNNPNFGYNIREGGGSTGSMSEETREKMRQAQTGKKHSQESRQKMSASKKGKYVGVNHPNYGKSLKEETKQKLREAKKGKLVGENNPMFGKTPSEETRKKMSDAKIGKPSPRRRKVYCIELDHIWDSISSAELELNVKHISEVINGKRNYAGRHPETNVPLHWIYFDNIYGNKKE
jgi:group I intron endonuclease